MEEENSRRTLGDYSRPSHEGYQNIIELPNGNNVVPLRSDTIRLVQNGCSFHRLRSEDPNQHLKDFLKLVDSLDLDVANRERTRLRLFQFSLCDQASNWLERPPAGSISTWEDLTTHFIAQFFPPGRTSKLQNDILMYTIDQAASGTLREKKRQRIVGIIRGENLTSIGHQVGNPKRSLLTGSSLSHLRQGCHELLRSGERLIELENQAINDRMTGALPSDTVKNPALNVNPTSISSARSYPIGAPLSSSNSLKSVKAINTCFKSTPNIQKDQLHVKTLTANEVETPKSKEPKNVLEDEFKDLYLNLPVLKVLAIVPICDALLDKYIESLELGKNGSSFIQGEIPNKMKDPGLFILPCRLGDSKPFDTLVDLGSSVNVIPLNLFKKLKMGLLEEIGDI
ncbi:MAK10-like protein [Tanacetum coccineum]|uniref:MAK10-like protein n=1 Tax=Tanacetum coccineum TaxID=301880 RepID=A0ABQ5A2W6_9ASTR